MAVTLQAGGTVQVGSTTLTVTGMASGLLENDILIMFIFHKALTTVPTIPAGWTEITGGARNSSNGHLHSWYKRVATGVTSQADQAASGMTSSCCGSMMAWRGAKVAGSPFILNDGLVEAASTASATENLNASIGGGAVTVPSPTGDAVVALWAIENDCTFSAQQIEAIAATEIGENNTALGTDCSGMSAWRRPSTANEVISSVQTTLTEVSAGSSLPVAVYLALAEQATATPSSYVTRRGPNYRR